MIPETQCPNCKSKYLALDHRMLEVYCLNFEFCHWSKSFKPAEVIELMVKSVTSN